ncbi:MAG: DNA repair protein RadC [Desulfuromonas thiophila]|jgi:DNA repair protein RadC|uniref:RadC family protein n=1 Tax=Desulfuromonas thiophila TaxID=57664 RepID=UPI0024A9D028|nr:DNA repair protein RadC [Desulfuromonas thiophila]MCK9172935.1 DNA repair protein RadC [Desulfuromonas thiophila]MDY0398008.1 DNA repair protein RadC [Desulfuromonas thiophila]
MDGLRRIKDWPEGERPREKLHQRGADSLSDAELLALILRTGDAASRTSAVDQARLLLQRFDSLARLARAGSAELCQIPGIGPAKSAELLAVFELARRLSAHCLQPGDPFCSAETVFQRYRNQFLHYNREVFLCLLLDTKHRLIREVRVSEGSLTASIVHPREAFSPAVRESAAAVLFLHNHPSGDPSPSTEDIQITRRLQQAGDLLGIRMLDHIIIGRDSYISLSQQGLLT